MELALFNSFVCNVAVADAMDGGAGGLQGL